MRLWDLYSKLLTPTQQEITNLYFNLDLTVSEIAETKGVSRQAVSECLATCKSQLSDYEEKMRFSETLRKQDLHLSFFMTDVSRWAEGFLKLHPEYAADIAVLQGLADRDYESEIRSALSAEKKIKEK